MLRNTTVKISELYKTDETAWPEPEPLPEGLPLVDELDPAIIPEPLKGWMMDVSERLQIPSCYSTATALVALASIIGRKIGIHPKKKDAWLVVPNLWGAIVGRPSLMKSPAVAEAIRPLNHLVAEAIKAHKQSMREHEMDLEVARAKQSALKDKLKQAAKNGDDLGQFRGEAVDLPKPPILKRYRTEDPTVEKLGEILLENPNGILVYRDELSGWLYSLEKQGREGDRAFYLESWNGTGSFTVDRIGRGTLHIPALCLSLFGSIQPGPLSAYVYAATKGGLGDDGLMQRFQMLVWPDAPSTWRNVDRWPNSAAKDRAYEIFKKLDALDAQSVGATQGEYGDIPGLRFSDAAQELFNGWREELEMRLRSRELHPALEAHLAKYRSLMPSLALIFHLVELADGKANGNTVGHETAAQAAAWCEFLESHAARLYASAQDPGIASARELLRHIERGDLTDGFTHRDIYRKGWSRLANPDESQAAMKILTDYGWILAEDVETTGRGKITFSIHPKLRTT